MDGLYSAEPPLPTRSKVWFTTICNAILCAAARCSIVQRLEGRHCSRSALVNFKPGFDFKSSLFSTHCKMRTALLQAKPSMARSSQLTISTQIRRADAQNSRAKNAMSLLLVTISLSLAVPAGGSLVFISQPNGQAPIAPLRRVLSKIPCSTF